MFSNPVPPSIMFFEGTVHQVDLLRKVCKVVTISGQKLSSVQWASGYGGNSRSSDLGHPASGDKVFGTIATGYPIIFGALSRVQTSDVKFPVNMNSGIPTPDTGNYAPGYPMNTCSANAPSDAVLGDRVMTSDGGGLLGVLRSGTILLQARPACSLLLSKLTGLARLVGRSLEVLSDASSDVYRNFAGRTFRYFGVSSVFSKARNEDYQYHLMHGDVSAADEVKTKKTPPTVPLDSVLAREKVTDTDGTRFTRDVFTDGVTDSKSTTSAGDVFTRIRQENGRLYLSNLDTTYIEVSGEDITLHHSEGASTTHSATGVVSTFQSGSVSISTDEVRLAFGDHFVSVSASGVAFG